VNKQLKAGYSLLEMTVVLVIISILTAAVIPQLIKQYTVNAANKVALDMSAIEEAGRAYYIANNSWPASIATLQTANYLPSSWNGINPFGYSAATPSTYSYNISSTTSLLTVNTYVPVAAQPIIQNLLPVTSVSGNIVYSNVTIPGASAPGFGQWQSINFNQVYQAPTDGYIDGSVYLQAGISGTQASSAEYYTSSTYPPTSNPGAAIPIWFYIAPGMTSREYQSFSFHVRKGDYYEMALTGGYESGVCLYFLPN
jgi:prepilin-type N-terminal cleavage/methylation domain-containing protein